MHAFGLHLIAVPYAVNLTLVTLVCAAAYWRGGWRERLLASFQVALAYFTQFVCSIPYCHTWPAMMPYLPWVEDTLQLAICLACAIRAKRYWVLWVSAFALADFITNAMSAVLGVSLWVFAASDYIWIYAINATILWGVWINVRDRRPAAARLS
jgi:hypothetical protein